VANEDHRPVESPRVDSAATTVLKLPNVAAVNSTVADIAEEEAGTIVGTTDDNMEESPDAVAIPEENSELLNQLETTDAVPTELALGNSVDVTDTVGTDRSDDPETAPRVSETDVTKAIEDAVEIVAVSETAGACDEVCGDSLD
jgi:hypothetical protein